MEKGSMIGLALCLAGVFVSAMLHGISPAFLFMETGSIIIVVVGHLGATISAFPFEVTQNVPKYVGKAMKGQEIQSASDTIAQIVVLTSRARAEGILVLEEEAKGIDDPFFRKGIDLAVDGTDPDALRHTLHAEIAAMKERHKVGQGWFMQAGTFAPTFGIIGAVFGLMATMAQLSHPQKVGVGIAGAFVATFWGVFLANGIWLPWANKLRQLSTAEVAHKRLIVEGIMAIQAGVSPRVVEELLKSHVPPVEREKKGASAKASGRRGGAAAAAA
jgi:chemotaxis protein MotA